MSRPRRSLIVLQDLAAAGVGERCCWLPSSPSCASRHGSAAVIDGLPLALRRGLASVRWRRSSPLVLRGGAPNRRLVLDDQGVTRRTRRHRSLPARQRHGAGSATTALTIALAGSVSRKHAPLRRRTQFQRAAVGRDYAEAIDSPRPVPLPTSRGRRMARRSGHSSGVIPDRCRSPRPSSALVGVASR